MGSRAILYIIFLVIPVLGCAQNDAALEKAKVFFKKVDRIELVKLEPYCTTWKSPVDSLGNYEEEIECYEQSIILKRLADNSNCPIDTSHIGETYTLQSEEFDLLFDMLYVGEPMRMSADCYNPRHGIVFYNSPGSIIGFLEICFECDRMHATRDTPNMSPLKDGPFRKLKLFFEEKNLVDPVDD